MIGIYKITNPKGRIYIGQSINIERRFLEYSRNAKNSIGIKLFNSLNKYNFSTHIFEIIEYCKIEELDEREIFWGLHFDSLNKGLNCRLGKGRGVCNEETKQKIKNSLKNHSIYYTDDIIQKMKKPKPLGFGDIISKSLKGRICPMKGKTQPFKGRKSPNKDNKYKHTLEAISKKYIPISQFDLKGNLIKEWPSIKDAKNITNILNINLALSGANKTAGKFIWKYKIS